MCTVSIVPTPGGFHLLCNRDERRDRVPAIGPRIRTTMSMQAVYPVDTQGRGTWIGVNAAGLAVALLNRTDDPAIAAARRRFSRGLIAPPLLECGCVEDAVRVARRVQANSFHPFRLLIVHERRFGLVSSNGRRLSSRIQVLDRPLMWTSSSLGDARVRRPRLRLFQDLIASHRKLDAQLEGQQSFHTHCWPARSELSVLMARTDARTVSRTAIHVSRGRVTLHYTALDGTPAASLISVARAA